MSRTYKATGINLKSMPMGEADRLLTILTREFGLVRALAMGSRKHNSRLGGRSGLFVVNELMLAKGRSIDKVTQAETLESYPGLGQDLKKLTASQYLAELCLCQALSDQPQEELFCILNEHLGRLERSPAVQVLAYLTHAIYQLLILSGIAPQVHLCCVTRQPLSPDFTDPGWQVGFSVASGGTVTLAALEQLVAEQPRPSASEPCLNTRPAKPAPPIKRGENAPRKTYQQTAFNFTLSAPQLAVLQELSQPNLSEQFIQA
ncbi:MAG TPA: DNA repair protein RecO, partial [Thermosynechococcaceae cyanobacterium]